MKDERKPETIIREMRRTINRYRADSAQSLSAIKGLAAERDRYRGQVTQAQQEVAEWKRRFDALLERTPKEAEGK